MLDLETMGNTPGAAILSIGAVFIKEGKLAEEFYMRTSLESCMEGGLTCDASTIVWWMKQDEDARKSITTTESKHIGEALVAMHEWARIACGGDFDTIEVWGNAATFDVVIIEEACRRMNYMIPWKFRGHRCYRTMKNAFPNVPKPDFVGVKHHALDDAKFQALHLINIFNHINRLQNMIDSATTPVSENQTTDEKEPSTQPVPDAATENHHSSCRSVQETSQEEKTYFDNEGIPHCKTCGREKCGCECEKASSEEDTPCPHGCADNESHHCTP